MVSGWGAGEAGNATRLDCDCYMPALSDGADPVLFVTVRGERNIGTVQVALGGPGGVAVPQDGEAWVPLPFPLRTGQWGRLTIVADPISRKAEGAFDVTVSQGNERESTPTSPSALTTRATTPARDIAQQTLRYPREGRRSSADGASRGDHGSWR